MAEPAPSHRNEVVLVGQISQAPEERSLASGAEIVTFRIDVTADTAESGAGRDSFECTVRAARTRRAALGWEVGDTVEVSGAVRRRFYRVGKASRPFTVIEAERARRLRTTGVTPRRRTHG